MVMPVLSSLVLLLLWREGETRETAILPYLPVFLAGGRIDFCCCCSEGHAEILVGWLLSSVHGWLLLSRSRGVSHGSAR